MDSAYKAVETDSLDKYGGRKFIFCVLLVTIFGVLTGIGMMPISDYMNFCLLVGSGYLVSNVGAKIAVK